MACADHVLPSDGQGWPRAMLAKGCADNVLLCPRALLATVWAGDVLGCPRSGQQGWLHSGMVTVSLATDWDGVFWSGYGLVWPRSVLDTGRAWNRMVCKLAAVPIPLSGYRLAWHRKGLDRGWLAMGWSVLAVGWCAVCVGLAGRALDWPLAELRWVGHWLSSTEAGLATSLTLHWLGWSGLGWPRAGLACPWAGRSLAFP
jgi:hypothetical protein